MCAGTRPQADLSPRGIYFEDFLASFCARCTHSLDEREEGLFFLLFFMVDLGECCIFLMLQPFPAPSTLVAFRGNSSE